MIRGAPLLILYGVLVTASNALVKISAGAEWFWPFLLPFAAGNIAGLGGVLGVQLAASLLLFHEALRPTEIAGAVLVTGGIILTGLAGERAKPAAASGEAQP